MQPEYLKSDSVKRLYRAVVRLIYVVLENKIGIGIGIGIGIIIVIEGFNFDPDK